MMTKEDEQYMCRALDLAERGGGFVHPNPLVGAVVVKEGRVIGEGWHARHGAPHAERNALEDCREDPRGATMYVTLEPCCHAGKTPPCADALVKAGVARVVVALEDPNPLVAGKGIRRLREAGVDVVTGVGEERAREQNRVFLKYIVTRRPWVTLKVAMTLDGKIATRSGDSRWITGEAARAMVHEERGRHMAVVVGVGTAIADDPLLTARVANGTVRQPARVVVDSLARLPVNGRIARTARLHETFVMHAPGAPADRLEVLRAAGVTCRACAGEGGRVDVADLCRQLGEEGDDSLLLEGGAELNYSFLSARLVDEALFFIAPRIAGGAAAKGPVGGEGAEWMRDALEVTGTRVSRVGEDILVRGRIKYNDDVHGNY
ncbi:MAG: bifunctional diaminohydroxyphosphoribosylaminopyrimidine deaminase/5-amino-6-(5-phosphoribosylamino)uracil reductase RibD [Odoribacteraceae bacterium]|nr:bifunctional diaminohydroxyphosphoribosylaminopyrimidine deaminase/5-amino-6-(5-phosphoribosylamino)uracil reductase RibD [Odoribacteraceae bacterium]